MMWLLLATQRGTVATVVAGDVICCCDNGELSVDTGTSAMEQSMMKIRHSSSRKPGQTQQLLLHLRRLAVERLESRWLLSTGPLHVDANSLAPAPDGLDSDTAYPALQDALDQAAVLNADGDAENDIKAIWIAEGVYLPSKDKHGSDAPEDARTVTFSLLSGVQNCPEMGSERT